MALWRDQFGKEPSEVEPVAAYQPAGATANDAPRSAKGGAAHEVIKESLLAAGLTIEGKIEGSGHVRIAGCFKGDIAVRGNLTIEAGAKVIGGVRADIIVVGGELEGNIEAASSVELLQSGILNGDLKAASLTVAAGSRMRGRAEFGWDEKNTATD